jgi:hypothetical protein
MAAGDRVLLGQPGSKIVVEMDSVTLSDPENPEGFGNVINSGTIESPGGTIVLAAGDIFSVPLHPQLRVNSAEPEEEPVYNVADQPVRVESGIGTVTQSGTINADGIDGDGGSVVLTAGDEVVLATGSTTSANGGISNAGADGGEVVAYASEFYAPDAEVDFQTGAEISVLGGTYEEPLDADAIDPAATFDGGLAEISGDHMYFDGTVYATATIGAFEIPGPDYPGDPLSRITIVPEGGTLHIDPLSLTVADGGIPLVDGAAEDTFYEEVLEAYSQAGVNTILEADYDITVEHITDGVIQGGRGDIALRTVYNDGGITFESATEGGPITTTVSTTAGDIFMLAGSRDIKTGMLTTEEEEVDVELLEGTLNGYILEPGRIRVFTNNGGTIDIEKGPVDGDPALMVDGGNDVEVSVIASGNLTINGDILTSTNNVPNKEQAGVAEVCLVSANGSVNVIGAIEVEAHGKGSTVARIHIDAGTTVTVYTGNGRVDAWADTAGSGTADAEIKIHAVSADPEAISVTNSGGNPPIRARAQTGGAGVGPLSVSDAVGEYEQWDPPAPEEPEAHLLVQIANDWAGGCEDCPVPDDLLPPVDPPQIAPIANDDDYNVDKGVINLILVIEGADGDPLDLIAWLLGDLIEGPTAEYDGVGGWVVLDQETGGFTYTPPSEQPFDEFGSDELGDYALFIDTFTYYVEDPDGLTSNEATVTITSRNYIPVAEADFYEVSHNVTLEPLAAEGIIQGLIQPDYTDHDADFDTLTPYFDDGLPGDVTSGATALGGTVTLNPDGSFSYVPPEDTIGTDSFSYYASDGYNDSGSVQVTIDLTNQLPVANPDLYDVSHNVALNVSTTDSGTIEGLLEGSEDFDPDTELAGDTLSAYLDGDGSTSLGGSVELATDGTFTYTPPADTVGTDSFTYYVSDGYEGGDSEPTTVTITLTNAQPVAQPDIYDVTQNVTLSPTVGQGVIEGLIPDYSDFDPDGDLLAPFLPGDVTEGPTTGGGYVVLNPDGSFTYEPPANWIGIDSFSYYVSDGYEGGNSELVWVTINVNVPPLPALTPAPGLEPVELATSGCPALVKWTAAELGADQKTIQVWVADSLASGRDMQPCDACAGLKTAAAILQDADGSHMAALAQVINELASSTAPPTEEQMASIADAIANNTDADSHYAAAGEYLDALAKYVGILNGEMGYSAGESIQFATDNYVGQLTEGENVGLAAYVAETLAALGG